jgi:hypothetical protein
MQGITLKTHDLIGRQTDVEPRRVNMKAQKPPALIKSIIPIESTTAEVASLDNKQNCPKTYVDYFGFKG